MKKVKFMLLSLALVAVVGAALAFKVRYSGTYCTAPVPGSPLTCTNIACPNAAASTTTFDTQVPFVCTVIMGMNGCQDAGGRDLQCVGSTRLVAD